VPSRYLRSARALALFNQVFNRLQRSRDLVALRVDEVEPNRHAFDRTNVRICNASMVRSPCAEPMPAKDLA
jgi:hypothetical protein